MSTSPANLKCFSSSSSPHTLGPQVSAITHHVDKSDPSPPRTVASRSSRQPRLSFSSFPVKSDDNPPPPLKEEATEERTWNLRPRKPCGGSKKANGNGGGGGASSEVNNQKPVVVETAKSSRQRGIPAESPGLVGGGGGGGVEVKSENHRLWVALSRDEIEEDVFSMSGNRPSRRPRKRAKTLQKHLDVIFPGLCLVGLNADCFRVSTSPAKR